MNKILAIILVMTQLSGCAGSIVLGTTAATQVTTGKSMTELALSKALGADCSVYKMLTANAQHKNVCEQAREPGTIYNRNPL